MNKKIELLIVMILAILYGTVTKVLINIPFMAWGSFDKVFRTAFILCSGLNVALYLLAYFCINGFDNYHKGIIYSFVFGVNAALVKLVMDTIVDAAYSKNYIRKIGIITFENILFGIIIITFLFLVVEKKKIYMKSVNFILPLSILCLIVIIYASYVEYNIGLLKQGIMIYDANEIQAVNLELSLSLKMVGFSTVIYTFFYIVFWWGMRRITIEKNSIQA